MENQIDTLFQKYKKGELSLKEELLLAELISDPDNSEADRFLKTDFNNHFDGQISEKREMKQVLHAIHHRIHLQQSEKQKSTVHQIYRWTSRIAAMLFIPFLLISIWLFLNPGANTEQTTLLQIVAPQGSRVNFELPDGTKGILNSGSQLDYSSAFASNRHIKLSGEAYFDVTRDAKNPFTVEANKNEIQVVGTKFTLAAWPGDELTELVLEEGKVLFKPPGTEKALKVAPGQRIVEKNGEIERSQVETWKYTAWKDGRLIFRNDSMEELARRISRWYNVEVEFDKKGLEEYTFRGVFENDPLEEVLRLLEMTSPINYIMEDRKINADGSFSRKKVIITRK